MTAAVLAPKRPRLYGRVDERDQRGAMFVTSSPCHFGFEHVRAKEELNNAFLDTIRINQVMQGVASGIFNLRSRRACRPLCGPSDSRLHGCSFRRGGML